ncbi:DUF6599 family protein [Occallatibacter riparius]|uniref:Uncharacterized protein n=1 Tax=Occallatibacter riparius TaxID=1002689 RepID=A0A9J7BRA5_9BACT|nr:DUF6599 family protein [Occallatibacter riparius]UWZ83605.1 hypothetical protein MOP44_23940 [Occallatibacter riparius]
MILRSSSLCMVVLAMASLLSGQQSGLQDPSHAALSKLLPEPLPSGVVAKAPPGFYTPDNLYQYMDGAADVFVLYGVRTLLHLDARDPSVDVTVDVFDMGSPDAAFGMYAAERAPDYHFISIGAEAYQNTGILNFVQDRYYVKLAGFGEGADAALETWARTLSSRIGANPALPSLLARLPAEGRKPHSEQYMPNDPLGHPFLGPAYVAAYSAGEAESKLYVTVARDDADALQRLKQLQEHFTRTGKCAAALDLAAGTIRGQNSFEGTVIARTAGRYLLVLLNPVSGNERILTSAADNLN